jgi:hypothetical protein
MRLSIIKPRNWSAKKLIFETWRARDNFDASAMEGNLSGSIWASNSYQPADTQEPESLMTLARPKQLPDMKPRREIYPKEQWLALKPIIQQLYVDEGQTFRKVAEYLHKHHDFNPT